VNETFSIFVRRAHEQRRSEQEISGLLDSLIHLVPKEAITWISFQTEQLYDQVVALIRDSSGELNFHDALIPLNCKRFKIKVIASFDRDFDQVEWLTPVERPDEVIGALGQVG